MHLTQAVTLAPQFSDNAAAIARSNVLIQGMKAPCIVDGVILEAAVECPKGFLLFVTDDVPFEETLNIHLLDAKGQLLDTARLGAAYTTGNFIDLALGEGHTLSFSFFGEKTWTVELLPQPGFRLPYLSEPAGVHRPLSFSRYFVVKGYPKPS
ncbi:MAG: hypothetical protein PW845_06760 [Pseudomonas sp.]|nr:hypothetical protein [Pseudomonas sp.]